MLDPATRSVENGADWSWNALTNATRNVSGTPVMDQRPNCRGIGGKRTVPDNVLDVGDTLCGCPQRHRALQR